MRTRLAWLALIVCAAAISSQPARGQQTTATANGTLVISDVTVIDGTGSPPRARLDVHVKDGRIAAIGPATSPVVADLVVRGTGLYLLPGLFDAHVHLSGMPWAPRVEQLRRVLNGGVTSVYDVAGDVRQTADLARAVLAREIEGPSIDYCALMAGSAFFDDPRVVASSLGYRPGEAPWAREITPQTDLVRAVAEAKGAGASAIKVYAGLEDALATRVIQEAARQGMRTVAHATVFPARPGDLVAAGVTLLAHSAYLVWQGSHPTPRFQDRARGDFEHVPVDGPVMTRLLEQMRDRHVALNPTLWIFASGSAKDDLAGVRTPWMNAVTKKASDLGVSIVAGTDGLLEPGAGGLPLLHRELEAEVAAGLTPMQALVSATSAAARAIGVDGDRGTLAVGQAADLLLVSADPLADIRNTRAIRFVFKGGRMVFDRAAGEGR